ncbi:MAG: threonylcarbamoyl-AMP synthase [Bacteroidetes bacterium]|nr:threonylcarbamoyl-AMP synthase [Bacteroidota bacterium]
MIDFEDDIKNCIITLEQGGIILYPTDTIWGLGCDAMNSTAVEKVFALKQRPREKSMIILLAEARDIIQYIAAPPPDIINTLESFDTPTTVIYDGALGFPDNVTADNGSIAIRVTRDPFCRALIKRFRRPIISTSANLSNRPSAATFSEVDPEIIAGCDYVVTHRQNDSTVHPPSRIVRLHDDGQLEILRG